ncbi:Uu.00g084930.m01.CDS01 [Anthostomella pinea]|uniref:Uu.00g084930.m01.CDS01 n=1 Tax=Anthostomella pinea TaxID=933095 RepID=A0AAI8YJS5_9PEZI|nr:Uu.00g084930.m01.CDS01 [Anthostomella pinea]
MAQGFLPDIVHTLWPLGLDVLFGALAASKEGRILKYFNGIVNECGSTFMQHLLGVPGIDTLDPENIEALLSTNFNDYDLGLRPMTFRALLGSGIFTQDGECVQRLVDSIPGNGVVDLQPLFFKLTFEITMFLLFSKHAYNLGEVTEKESTFAGAFNLAQDYLAHRGRLGDMYWLFNDKKFHDACKICHDFIDATVGKALEAGKGNIDNDDDEGNYVFIDALVQQTRNPTILRDQRLNVLLAGRDTTGCCLSWTM